jgi:predicted nucleotidyltransferase
MKSFDSLVVASEQCRALQDLMLMLLPAFDIEQLVIYGSVARSEADNESDLDVLVLTNQPLTRFERHRITDIVFDINLQYGTNVSTLVVDQNSWKAGPISVLPIREEIRRDGILLWKKKNNT